jgi:RNA-directed DNA polymerase
MSREAHVRICGGRRVRFPPATRRRQRPLGIAALEDKLLQRAVVEVLNAI